MPTGKYDYRKLNDPTGPHIRRNQFSDDAMCGAMGFHVRYVLVGSKAGCPVCRQGYAERMQRGKARFNAKRATAT